MTSWRPLHPYTYSLDLGGAAADRPDSTVHLNLKPKPNPLIQLFPLCRKYDTIYTI